MTVSETGGQKRLADTKVKMLNQDLDQCNAAYK